MHNTDKLGGCKFLHLKCTHRGFIARQETGRPLLQISDPEGLEHRRRRTITDVCSSTRNQINDGTL